MTLEFNFGLEVDLLFPFMFSQVFGFISMLLFFVDAILFCVHKANRVIVPPQPVVVQQQQGVVIHQQTAVVQVTQQ